MILKSKGSEKVWIQQGMVWNMFVFVGFWGGRLNVCLCVFISALVFVRFFITLPPPPKMKKNVFL